MMAHKSIKKNVFFLSFFSVLFFLPFSLFGQENSCIACHKELEGELLQPVEAFPLDIHNQVGLSCESCHGGNPREEDIDLAKDKTFRGKPERKDIPEFCASCHADANYMKSFNPSIRVDQLSLYWTSWHGQLLKKGDRKVAVCSDCHDVHRIQQGTHPKSWTFPWNIPQTCGRCHSNKEYMADYKIPTNQEAEYRKSVHAHALFDKKDLSAPVCNDCHGNHGAAPPEVTSIAQVCRQCHPSPGKLFSESPHKSAFDELEISECEACHGNHRIDPPTDEMLGTGEKGVCIQCHDEGTQPFQVASRMREMILDLSGKIEKADDLLSRAYQKGVEVSDPRYQLNEVNTLLVMIRDLTHGLSLESINAKVKEADQKAAGVISEGEEALREARRRRTGLIITLIFIFLLATGLFLKIRQKR
jgi:predicted CXXCH cytochrome family protein